MKARAKAAAKRTEARSALKTPAKAASSVGAPAAGPKETPSGKPTPPRLTVRTPAGADELKQKIGALATAIAQIRTLKKTLSKSFFEIGLILRNIGEGKLYEVKGYGSFEAFVERELDLGKQTALRLARAAQVFQREPALEAGIDRVVAAIAVFDGEVDPSAVPPAPSPTSSGGARSPIPFHKQ
jgi:hypothetical protein